MPIQISESDFVALHLSPAWADRANFKVFANISDGDSEPEWEQLWVEKLENAQYRVCCLPFFTYGLSIGDIVHVDDRLVVKEIVEKSGNSTVRIFFANPDTDGASEVGARFFDLGYLVEWQSNKMLAVNCSDENEKRLLIDWLEARKGKVEVEYECA